MEADTLQAENINTIYFVKQEGANLHGVQDGRFPEHGLDPSHASDDVLDLAKRVNWHSKAE